MFTDVYNLLYYVFAQWVNSSCHIQKHFRKQFSCYPCLSGCVFVRFMLNLRQSVSLFGIGLPPFICVLYGKDISSPKFFQAGKIMKKITLLLLILLMFLTSCSPAEVSSTSNDPSSLADVNTGSIYPHRTADAHADAGSDTAADANGICQAVRSHIGAVGPQRARVPIRKN